MEERMAGWRDITWRIERIETPEMKVFSGHVAFGNGAEMEATLEIWREPRARLGRPRKALSARAQDREQREIR
jgi:hypothetical protein